MRKIFLIIVLVLSISDLHAFPEMVRHGYTNCLSCHVSPNGGGALSLYGRELSKEILSTWSAKKEHQPLHGLLDQNKFPSWLYTVGGDVRGLQYHMENEFTREGDWMWMQMEAEIGLKVKALKMNASVAKFEKEGGDEYVLRKAFAMLPLGKESTIKIGQFKTIYGINMANHTSMVKKDLGLGARSETYNAEYSWIGEKWNYVASASLPKQERTRKLNEKKFNQQLSYNISKNYKTGISHMLIKNDLEDKQAYGVFGLLGFTKKLYSLVEINIVENETLTQNKKFGAAMYSKLGYEIFKGFHVNSTAEVFQNDWDDSRTKKTSYGAGLQWFPRPHFEFQVTWNKLKIEAVGDSWSDMAYFVFHYYI